MKQETKIGLTAKMVLRKSGYKDYVAIDKIGTDNKIISTPLYLRKNETKKCKIKYDWHEWDGHTKRECSEMIKGEIKFDGSKIMATYIGLQSGIYWWEPTEFELTIGTIFHFKS